MGIIESMAVVGGLGFFAFIAVMIIIGVISAEMDNVIAAVITMLLLFGGAQLVFGIQISAMVMANPLIIVFGLLVYTVIGLSYAVFFRYAEFLNINADRIRHKATSFFTSPKGKDKTEDDFLESDDYAPFTPSHNVDKITAWLVLWPWGMFWDLCSKPTTWIYNTVYSLAGVMLDKVGKRVTKKILAKK